MSVELQPSAQLGFHRPLTQLVKRTLTVTNTNSQPVAFKVKTTAPKQYCVRPNSGRIEPNERVEVQVLLQPMKEEPPAGTRCKDKFLVQSATITPDRETKTLADLWSSVEADVKAGRDGVVHEQKIRCAYLPPVEGGASGEGGEAPPYNGIHAGTDNGDTSMATSHSASGFAAVANGATPSRFEDTRTAPSSVISQKPSAGPATTTTNTTNPTINGVSSASEGTTDNASAAEKIKAAVPSSVEEAKAAALGAASAVGAAATGAAASLGLTGASGDSASLQKELANARAEIERLKMIINQKDGGASAGAEGLRQRNVGSSSAATSSSSGAPGAATATVTQQGVPLPMVGALCAGVFVFTYLFF